ncbi:Ribosomal protein S18 acetylase RimI [Klenkia marina]|uniref:Ribosomal protein S18 acetylase RimI n=1 Tax=Klenkia marina TaxID=1960309 RepID=A0A1G4Z377_9ACTN|nr:GNAT family N-acetyltransferase [Klenkia marina]SCX60099.1 Ribosomal protein S18 acetylase RimI [Klenkia marina]
MQLTGRAESSVRPAVPADAADIARVQRVTWRTAYRALLPADALDAWDDDAAATAWRSAVEAPPTPGHGVLVACEGSTVVGFLAHAPAELAPHEPRSPHGPAAELTALLVEPRWGRRGHGSRLLAAAVDLLEPVGVRDLRMWVPEEDRVTSGFLQSAGWAADSWTRGLEADGRTIRERRWHALLAEDGDQA